MEWGTFRPSVKGTHRWDCDSLGPSSIPTPGSWGLFIPLHISAALALPAEAAHPVTASVAKAVSTNKLFWLPVFFYSQNSLLAVLALQFPYYLLLGKGKATCP